VPPGAEESIDAPYWPESKTAEGVPESASPTRPLTFSRTVLIEQDDFMEQPPAGYHRLAPGRSVRLRHAYVVTCTGVVKNEQGELTEVHCTHDPSTRGGGTPDGKRVDGTIHWVSAERAVDLEVRLYDRLFSVETPGEGGRDPIEDLNPRSLEIVRAKGEPSLASAKAGDRFQFERLGYFYADPDTQPGALVANRVVPLKDSWAKVAKKNETKGESAPRKERAVDRGAPRPQQKKPEAVELSAEAATLRDAHGLPDEAARVIAQEALLSALMTETLAAPGGAALAKPVALLLVNEVLGEARSRKLEALPFGGVALVELSTLLKEGTLSSAQVKEVLGEMIQTGKAPRAIVKEKGLAQIATSDALEPLVDEVLAANTDAVGRFRAGNANVIGALVGMVMKKSGGRANAKLVTELLKAKLG
jgi:glutaminyl-tRNA synthetase